MTCNHLFPSENEYSFTRDLEDIGACVFTTRDKGYDCVAIEIKECYSKSCDVVLRRDDKKKMNANVYSNSLQNENIVHEKGATRDVTNGIIVSSKFLFKSNRQKQPGNIFFVKGIAEKVFERGDSGSLLFPDRIVYNKTTLIWYTPITLYCTMMTKTAMLKIKTK